MTIFTKKTSWQSYLASQSSTEKFAVSDKSQQRICFLGITTKTLELVKEASPYVLPYKNEIVEKFYENLMSIPHLHTMIKDHSTVNHLKKMMDRYIEQFFEGKLDHAYNESRIMIGRVHSKIHLTPDHFLSAHHLVLEMITSILMEKLQKQPERLKNCLLAIQKLGTYDQQLIIDVYTEHTVKSFLFGISQLLNETTQLDTTKNLIASMERQIEETQNVSMATEELSSSVQDVANHAVSSAEKTEEAVKNAESSKFVIDEALNTILGINNNFNEIVSRVDVLTKEIHSTQNVVQVIHDIAEQTNLLALNASIEAARAGEHGNGFAVVAGEVRKLSEHTKEQIVKITDNIKSLQQVSTEVAEQIQLTQQLVTSSVNGAETAGVALRDIVEKMQEINEATGHIAAMSEEQTATTIEIAERNSVISEHSKESQQNSQNTASAIFELSTQMDSFRQSFFQVNMQFDTKDILQVAITDHLVWKWKVYNMMLGVITIDINSITSSKECRLGKWYYSELPREIKNSIEYQSLEIPHRKVHELAVEAVKLYTKGDSIGVTNIFTELEKNSNLVVNLLNRLVDKC